MQPAGQKGRESVKVSEITEKQTVINVDGITIDDLLSLGLVDEIDRADPKATLVGLVFVSSKNKGFAILSRIMPPKKQKPNKLAIQSLQSAGEADLTSVAEVIKRLAQRRKR